MRSFHLYDPGRPTEANLVERFGTKPPELYTRFAQWCYDRAGGDRDAAAYLYQDLLNLEATDVDSDGYASPIELFSIGDDDGNQVGWINLAPEHPADDYPWAWYLHDGSSLWHLAANTRDFFTQLLSHTLVGEPEDPPTPQLQAEVLAAADALGLTLSEAMGRSRGSFGCWPYYKHNEPAPELQIEIPPGYRYVPPDPTDETIGVLAPAERFAPGDHAVNRQQNVQTVATDLLAHGHAASAVWHLLTMHARCDNRFFYDEWLRLTKQAYEQLGRPLMAKRAEEAGGW